MKPKRAETVLPKELCKMFPNVSWGWALYQMWLVAISIWFTVSTHGTIWLWSHWWPSGYSRRLSDMNCSVMIWRSWVRTPVGSNLGCVVYFCPKSYLNQKYLLRNSLKCFAVRSLISFLEFRSSRSEHDWLSFVTGIHNWSDSTPSDKVCIHVMYEMCSPWKDEIVQGSFKAQ